ncbi:MAG: MFS transporter [Dehalococcoidia bacterium]
MSVEASAVRTDTAERRFAAFGLLHERDFRLLFMGMTVSSLAMPMQWIVQMWLVLDLTGGAHAALWLGLSGFVRGLPLLLLSLHGGALADRMDRRTLLAITQVASIAVAVTIAALMATGLLTIWLFLPLAFLSSAVMSFDQPARQALVPDLVPPERVTQAVTLNSMAMFSSMAVGPALAGFLIQAVGPAGSYIVIATTYLGVLIAVLLLRPQPPSGQRHATQGSALAEIGEGLRYVRREPVILWLISVTFAMTVLGMAFTNLAPLLVTDVLGGSATSLGWIFAAWGIGAIVGSVVLAGWLDQIRSKGAFVLGMVGLFVAGLVCFAYAGSVSLAALFQFMPGLANTSIMVVSNAVILSVAPAALRGRVMGIYYMNRGLMPIGALVSAVLGEAVGVQHAIATLALLSGLGVVLVTLRQPGVWRRVQTQQAGV